MSLNIGVLAFFKLDETGSVNQRADFFGGPGLDPTGGANGAAGHIGSGVAFNGSSFLLQTDDIFSLRVGLLDPSGGVSKTMTFWTNANSWASQPGVISNWANAGGPVQWLLYADDSTHLTFQVRDILGVDHTARVLAPSTDSWRFIVLTYDAATGDLGISIDNGAFTTANTLTVINGAGSIEVGNRNNGAAGLNGRFDALGFWNRVLTSDELTELYNSGVGIEPLFDAVGNSLFLLG